MASTWNQFFYGRSGNDPDYSGETDAEHQYYKDNPNAAPGSAPGDTSGSQTINNPNNPMANFQSGITDYANQMSQYMKMLMGPIDPNDPTWGPYIKSITSTAQSMAGGANQASGVSGGLAVQGVQAAGVNALANMNMQRMGLGLQAGQQALGGLSTGMQGLYNQQAIQQGNMMNGISLLTGGAGLAMRAFAPSSSSSSSNGGGY
jgi:hypothetical protein